MTNHLSLVTLLRPALVMVLSLVVGSLVGCGGQSSSGDAEAGPPARPTYAARGQLFPATAGVTVAEYDAEGRLLQWSSPSDEAGAFEFEYELTGARVTALAGDGTLRVPDTWSALITSAVEVRMTPLSALQEHLVSAGAAKATANATLRDWLAAVCGAEASRLARAVLDDPVGDDTRAVWLQRALASYIRAHKDLGAREDAGWMARLSARSPLLGSQCELSRWLHSDDWAADIVARAPEAAALSASLRARYAELMRKRVTNELLRLMGTSLAVTEYPELLPVLGPRIAAWQGREREVAQLLSQDMHGDVLAIVVGRGTASGIQPPAPAPAAPLLSDAGNVQFSLRSTIASPLKAGAAWRIGNDADTDQSITLAINGARLFGRESLISEMLRLPKTSADEGLHVRAFRFVTMWRRPHPQFTPGLFQHQVDLYLRSIGAGRCDDDASALRELWSMLGFEARVWGVGGHIVPEVLVDGRWEMYDPHYGVYYKKRDGTVAGVADLHADPSLVSDPTDPVDPTGLSYQPEVVEVYADAEGDRVYGFYSADPLEPMSHVFVLPAGGRIEVDVGTTYSFPAQQSSDPGVMMATGQVRIWFPPGYSGGPIDLPLVLADATGSGQLNVLGTDLDVTPAGIRPFLLNYYDPGRDLVEPDVGVTRVTVGEVGPEGLTLTLLLNPKYFERAADATLQVFASSGNGLRLTVGGASAPN